jgi:penicillin-binding protein 1A
MAAGRHTAKVRREPVFGETQKDVDRASDMRLRPEDRPSGDSRPKSQKPRSAAPARARRKSSGRKKRGGGNGGGITGLLRRGAYWGMVACLWAVIGGIGLVAWVGAHLPPIQSLEIPKRPPSIQILGTDGHVLITRGDMGGAAVPLAQMPLYLPQAIVAIEDRRFYLHPGVDPLGILRAAVANVLHRGVSQGGSTLTQQLAKNLFLTQERTMSRKVQELVLALWLEHKHSKKEILELYLNRVYFGAGAYGVEAASQRYFGKSARQISLAEAAMLAGLVKSPSRLAPTRNLDRAQKRAQVVLAAMADAKFITPAAEKTAMANPARAVNPGGAGSVNYAADWIMDVLDDLIGRVEEDITVRTTIDPKLQTVAEKALVDELNEKGQRFNVGQGAIVTMTPEGAVRALVGGRDYAASQFNRAVAAKRQPGSAFKPFVYLTALERGLTPDTIREDKPIAIKGWKPENYGHEYHGAVTLTQALAMSLNTVSVRLTMEFGPANVAKTAYRLGITSKLEPNASLALGTSEVSVLELVGAYAPFANGGMSITPHVIDSVRAANGKSLYQRNAESPGRIIDPHYVSMMNLMMMETLLTGTAKKAALDGWPAAGKTGTSQDFRDAWFVGYTSQYVTGVWLGNDDGTSTKKMTGGGLPVDVWSRVMKQAHQGVAVVGLPGLAGGAGNVAPNMTLPAMDMPVADNAPPARIPGTAQMAQRPQMQPQNHGQGQQPRRGIDDWLVDRLFGR